MTSAVRSALGNWLETKSPGPTLFSAGDGSRLKSESDEALDPDQASRRLSRVLSNSKWSVLRGWHVFRHSFISNCASRGVDQRFIDEWVGHQTDDQRRRYRHLFPESQLEAIELAFV